jgi:hypothetical protein
VRHLPSSNSIGISSISYRMRFPIFVGNKSLYNWASIIGRIWRNSFAIETRIANLASSKSSRKTFCSSGTISTGTSSETERRSMIRPNSRRASNPPPRSRLEISSIERMVRLVYPVFSLVAHSLANASRIVELVGKLVNSSSSSLGGRDGGSSLKRSALRQRGGGSCFEDWTSIMIRNDRPHQNLAQFLNFIGWHL